MTIRCSQCDRTFSVADDARGETVCPLCREAADIEPGTVLDDFRVDALLARGGMATVYRGTQISLNRPVAIKVLAQELTERPQFVERFRSEARLMAQLDHASVVKALGAGASQGAFYIAMEYVDGESLAARLARTGKLPLQEAVGLVDGVAAALEYAHGQNVVHRDIKPANVLIGADGRPKVTDFGIARLTGADDAVQNRLTVPHSQMGSAHYMAPEQMKDASSVDHRADIYALGVLLYETLTGEPPVGQFKPASQMAEGVPGQVDQVVRHALAPNRDERLATAAQFRALLQRAASGAAPPRAQHPPRTRLSRVPVQEKKRTGLFVAAAALLAVGVALFLLLRSGGKEPDKPTSPNPTVAQSKADSPTPRPAPAVQVDPVAPPRPEPDPELDLAPLPGPELALAAAPGPEPPPGPAHLQFPPAQGDWTPLFDGKTLAGWTTRKGAWSVDGDAIVCKVGSQDALCTLDGAEFGDFVLEADVRNLGPGPRFGLIFRKKGDNYISFGLNGQFNGITCKAGSGVWKATLDGVTIQRLPAAGLKVEKDTWYTLRVVCHGERFACYVDDVLVVTGTDGALGAGQVGLCAHRALARFRNVRIRTTAPAAALAAANPPPEQERERPGPAFELNVRVRLDGKSDLVITPGAVHWLHRDAQKPKYPFLNGKRWRPEWDNKQSAPHQVDGLPRDLRGLDCGVEKVKGRDRIFLIEHSANRIVIRFVDAKKGADDYEARITFHPRAPLKQGQWVSLFDGRTLTGWVTPVVHAFTKHSTVTVEDGAIVLAKGGLATGAQLARPFPSDNYELEFEVRRRQGEQLINVVFPIGLSRTSLHLASNLGLDLVDGRRPDKNITHSRLKVKSDHWYKVRLRLAEGMVEAWIDGKQFVRLPIAGHTFTVDSTWKLVDRLTFLSWNTTSELRAVRYRILDAPVPQQIVFGAQAAPAEEPFEDDFEFSGMLHWALGDGVWRTSEGALVTRAPQRKNHWLFVQDRAYGDFALEADVTCTPEEKGARFGFVFRRVNGRELLFSLSAEHKTALLSAVHGYDPLPKEGVPGITVAQGKHPIDVQPGQSYHLKVECVGTRVRCWVDGVLVGQGTDETLLKGAIGMHVRRAAARFDNVSIRPLPPPADADEKLGRLWADRAERLSQSAATVQAKLTAFEDVLERFPKATPAYRSYVKKRVDEARRLLAQADGWLSPLARSVQLGVFNTIAREMPGGRLRVLYPGAKYDQQNDWSVSHGYVHTSGEYNFCMHRVSHPLNAFHWLYRHGENVRLSFRAKAHCPHGCVLFGVPGAADGAGLVLSVGADRKSATTLGIAGQPPLYRDKVGAHGSWTTYTLAVTDGQLTFHRADKLLFTGRIDVGGLRGRDVIFWGKPLPSDKDRSPKFDDIKIDSLPQHDWVACHRRGTLPVRPTDRPDPSGWLGLSTTLRHPQFPRYAIWSRTRWGASSGNTTVLSVSTYGQPHLALSTLSGIRDCIITARVEFPERVVPDRSCSFGIVCRATGDGAYVGAVSPHGDAAISARKYRRSAGLDPIARGTLPVEPGRFLNVVAIVQGSRLELYCNGHRAVSTDQLPDTTGRVGVELTDGAAILHDVKYRLLPSDPGYDALYRKARP